MPPIVSKRRGLTTNAYIESGEPRTLSSTSSHSQTSEGHTDGEMNGSALVNGVHSSELTVGQESHAGVRDTSLELSSRREIIEFLDAEPTFDYLVQNGVLTRSDVAEIACEPEPCQQNRRLLQLVGARGEVAGVQLLTNVLRLTGQHYLANLLDDGARIKALSGSGYLSKSRHTGQVSVTIRIVSIQLPSDPQLKAVSALLGTEWISLEDIQMKISSLKRSQRSSMAHQPLNVVEEHYMTELVVEQQDCCCYWCCCCCCLPPRHHEKYAATSTTIAPTETEYPKTENHTGEPKSMVVTYQPGHTKSASIECIALSKEDTSLDSLRRAADNVQARCVAIYSTIAESGTPLRAGVERYFEQDRGVLVLSAESLGAGGGIMILCICTRPEHVHQLRDDQNGKLVGDLEKVIYTATASLVKLEVVVDSNELELAESELRSR